MTDRDQRIEETKARLRALPLKKIRAEASELGMNRAANTMSKSLLIGAIAWELEARR